MSREDGVCTASVARNCPSWKGASRPQAELTDGDEVGCPCRPKGHAKEACFAHSDCSVGKLNR